MINIDSGKCIGCRKGVYPWQKNKDGDYEHIDLFATQAAGAIYKCANSKEIEPYIYERADSKGVYRPNEELKEFLNQEDFWFEDIVNLAHRIFDDWEKVKEFFDMGEEGKKNWQLPKEELEGALYAMAKAVNIEVTEEEYPDFAMWKKKI